MMTHKKFGGVVPEVASRQHVEVMTTVIDEALKMQICKWMTLMQ